MNSILNNFPKPRIELPENYQKIYIEHCKKNRAGQTTVTSLSQKMEVWLHKKVASDVLNDKSKKTLEIGAGTLNQLKYEHSTIYDIVEPYSGYYKDSPFLNKVNAIYSDIEEVPSVLKYDRIISIATFEHIMNLPKVVAKSCLLLNNNGTLRISIPNEGSILWTIGWKLTTGLEFYLKYKMKYKLFLQYEHVNTADEIEQVLKHFYKNVQTSCFGLNKKFSIYRFFECTLPDIKKAQDYLQGSF